MTEEFKKEVALENEKKRKETEGRPSKENCTPTGVQNTDDNRSRSNTWTDSQTAKKAGVGVGTLPYGSTNPNNAKWQLNM